MDNMPYKLRQVGEGFKIKSPNHPQGFSKKPMTLKNARAQLRAILMNAKGK